MLLVGLRLVTLRREFVFPDQMPVSAVERADQETHPVAVAIDTRATEGPLIVWRLCSTAHQCRVPSWPQRTPAKL